MKQQPPKHVAIIMDGNRRWAEKCGFSTIEGHKAGADIAQNIVKYLDSKGIEYVTLYSFSTENWNRPYEEVSELIHMLEKYVDRESKKLDKLGFRIRHLGRTDRLSDKLNRALNEAAQNTSDNKGITVNFAFDYGGRTEIVQAVKQIIKQGLDPELLDENRFAGYLYTSSMPDVDLLVRTGGEIRISNFLLWQLAYAELYFTPVLWPDFDTGEMARALAAFENRERRFGGD